MVLNLTNYYGNKYGVVELEKTGFNSAKPVGKNWTQPTDRWTYQCGGSSINRADCPFILGNHS